MNNWITKDEDIAQYLSHRDLETLIRWLKRSSIKRVKLAGGEPMLHPYLIEFVEELVNKGIIIDGVLTNGLGETTLYEKVSKISDTNWLVNIGHPDTYSESEWELLKDNLEIMQWRNEDASVKTSGFDLKSLRQLCLSITFFEPEQDFDYIIDVAKEYGCPVIRYDVSRPSSDKTNKYVDFDKLIKIKPTLMRFVRKCVKEGIKPGMDDAIPFCIFSQRELMYLHLFSNFYSICVPHSDVFPDLTISYCTSMRDILPSYILKGGKNAVQIFQEHIKLVNKYREIDLPRCKNCYNSHLQLCQGYCLRFKADLLKKEEEKEKKSSRWSLFR